VKDCLRSTSEIPVGPRHRQTVATRFGSRSWPIGGQKWRPRTSQQGQRSSGRVKKKARHQQRRRSALGVHPPNDRAGTTGPTIPAALAKAPKTSTTIRQPGPGLAKSTHARALANRATGRRSAGAPRFNVRVRQTWMPVRQTVHVHVSSLRAEHNRNSQRDPIPARMQSFVGGWSKPRGPKLTSSGERSVFHEIELKPIGTDLQNAARGRSRQRRRLMRNSRWRAKTSTTDYPRD